MWKIIAVQASDGEWYRGYNLSFEKENKPKVFLIDVGYYEPALKYFPLNPKYYEIPTQLAVIKPI